MKKPLIGYKKTRRVEVVLIVLVCVLALAARQVSINREILGVICLLCLAAFVVIDWLFGRCPHCGRNLDPLRFWRNRGVCPHCGEPLDEEPLPRHVEETASAKVNLTLAVGEKRPDGYHEVETVMTCAALCDSVILDRNAGPWDKLVCDPPVTERSGDNLCMKALRLFFQELGVKEDFVTITLEKHIPTQAGLGGGSSDAAAVLRGLRAMYAPELSDERLEKMAAQLGSDVPFFIRGGTALATGRGEVLHGLPRMPECWFVIVKPEESHSTAAMFAAIDSAPGRTGGDSRTVREGLEKGDLSAIAAGMGNDFQQVLPENSAVPAIVKALRQQGALNAQMTGSGSAVFSLFACQADAETASEALKKNYPCTFCVTQV